MRTRLFVLLAVAPLACRPAGSSSSSAAASSASAVTVTAASSAPSAAAPTGKTYAIHFGHDRHPGDSVHLVADDENEEHTTAQLEGATAKDTKKNVHVHFDGTDLVEALQPDGHSVLREALTVGELWETKDGGPQDALARAGARIELTRAAKKADAKVTVEGRAASKMVRDALDALSSLKTHTGPSDNDIFGTTAPQAVGAEWPANVALAEADLAARGIVVAPGSLQGSSKLVSVSSDGGVDCLEIESHVRVGSLRSLKDLPPGSTVEDASIDVVFHTSLPVDASRVEPRSDMRLTMKGTFEVPSPKGKVRVTLDSVDFKRTAVK